MIPIRHSTATFANIQRFVSGVDSVVQDDVHDYDELLVITGGGYHVETADGVIDATVGDVVLMPMGLPHREWNHPGEPFGCLHLLFVWPDRPDDLPLHLRDERGQIRAIAEALLKEWQAYSFHRFVTRDFVFHGILGELLRLAGQEEHAMVQQTRDFVRAHLGDPIRLDDLAANVGMSKYHFARQYKALTGTTPMRDVQVFRLEKARELLLTTSLPLKAIAPRVGIYDDCHLSRLLSRVLGVHTRAIRRAGPVGQVAAGNGV